MHKLVFTGPSLSCAEIEELGLSNQSVQIDSIKDFNEKKHLYEDVICILPPVSGGDLYAVNSLDSSSAIGIIDGYFENCVSVWHKEILFLLSKGIKIFGASSMGALRAAELSEFGMIGIGRIFKDFFSGVLCDDDEVTISHSPAALGYLNISEAMVNIRYSMEDALAAGIINKNTHAIFLEVAKNTFYKKRNYGYLIRKCIEEYDCLEASFSELYNWLEIHRTDQKKKDAIQLIREIDSFDAKKSASTVNFNFEDTVLWRHAITS